MPWNLIDTDSHIVMLADADCRDVVFDGLDVLPPFAELTLEEAYLLFRFRSMEIYIAIHGMDFEPDFSAIDDPDD